MDLKQRIRRGLVQQFGRPKGPVGRLVGVTMAHRSSNVERARWTVGRLGLSAGDRVLELGCGPGVGIAAAVATGAHVVGVDHSPVMITQAARRNRAAVRAGHVELVMASAEALPDLGAPFDCAFAVNTVGHWADPASGLSAVRERLRPGGTLAVTSQPRCPGATAADSERAAAGLREQLTAAGLTDLRVEMLPLDPPAVCVLGYAP